MALCPGLRRLLEHPPRAFHVQLAGGVACGEDRECQVHHRVRALHEFANAALVLHVTLAVFGLLPAPLGGIERPPGHPHHALDRARALEGGYDGDAQIAGGAGDRNGQPLRRHRAFVSHRPPCVKAGATMTAWLR